MIDWIPKQHISTFSNLPAAHRRRIWRALYAATFHNPRSIFTFVLLVAATTSGILYTSPFSAILFFVSFWLHWAVCGRIAYPKVEEALRADGLLSDQTPKRD